LYGIILIFRPKKSGKLYDSIWDKKKDQSPLKVFTKSIANKLQQKYKKEKIEFAYAMNYGFPKIEEELKRLKNNGCERILIFPMYPQYSATTTASVSDNVNRYLAKERWQPTIRFVPPYYDDTEYINTLYYHIKKNLKKSKSKKILCSFHGIPKKYFFKGDPYHCHCAKTVRLLNEKFKKEKIELEMSFQSRFGPQEWLKPYMQEKMDEFLEESQKDLIVVAPGFSVDCLETLEEIEIQGKEEFFEKGGESFNYIRCLNDSEISINMYSKIINRELSGWI
jgi:ferrochelatase